MDVILDTCALLSLAGLVEKRISAETLDIVRSAYQVGVSSCSLFEISIKHKKKSLELGPFSSPLEFWSIALREYDLVSLPVTDSIFYQSACLPDHHGDPFDRIIIAHAQAGFTPVVTFDSFFDSYDISTLS
jgi:PIN domain nuclease of toxin-antitoxin system